MNSSVAPKHVMPDQLRISAVRKVLAVCTVVGLAVAASACSSSSSKSAASTSESGTTTSKSSKGLPPITHVIVVMLENKSYDGTWGTNSKAPYLAQSLANQGTLLTGYYGIGHFSLGNYIAAISGQAPNKNTSMDCAGYIDFKATGPLDADGQMPGQGCVFPASLQTLPGQLTAKGLTWKGYFEDMGNDPARDGGATCAHPPIGAADGAFAATATDQYATRHNPFVYFHSIIDDEAACKGNVVPLDRVESDLATPKTAPNFAWITPNLCNDGHDAKCAGTNAAGGKEGGLVGINAWTKKWIPKILASPTYKAGNTLVIITFDESEISETSSCCNQKAGPNAPTSERSAIGGGHIGALLLSPHVTPGAQVATGYNHYSMLRTIEDLFGLPHLGFAAAKGLKPFGTDVFKKP